MKIIVGTSGRINEILKGVPNEEFMGIATENEKAWVVLKSDVIPIAAGEVKIVEKEVIKEVEIEVIKEVIKEVPFDNPELLEQIQTLQDALGDALNAEEKAKKEAEELKKQIPKLKASVAKLKKALAED